MPMALGEDAMKAARIFHLQIRNSFDSSVVEVLIETSVVSSGFYLDDWQRTSMLARHG
jgi:hypothetical protein